MSEQVARRALVSVSDKTGLESLAAGLVDLGFEIVSTGGTRRFLEQRGVTVLDVSAYTGFPEIMNGRVKTLHPKVHGAILGRPHLGSDAAAIAEHGIVLFELVVCNLYPFEQTIVGEGVSVSEAIEQIDIGGPSMIRSAAKNHARVAVVTQPGQYAGFVHRLREGSLTQEYRRQLAATAFEMTARYDRAIADYMNSIANDAPAAPFPDLLTLGFQRRAALRYGENPHQRAAWFVEAGAPQWSLAAAEQLHGKDLSYNNLLDLDAAMLTVAEFAQPAAAVIKHNNPCGCSVATSLREALARAYEGDPVSAFGSIIGCNRPVDGPTAEELCQPERFVEAVIAPDWDHEALDMLTTRPKWKNSIRLIKMAVPPRGLAVTLDYRSISGGLLVQDRDEQPDDASGWKTVTSREPTPQQREDLAFTWQVCRHVKSNAIVFGRSGQVVGVGAGQMSRLDSVFMASHKASQRARDGVMASDAFFPFRDGIDEAARVGIAAVIQPGGSRRDDEVIEACNEHGIAMVFTGQRHFRH